MALTTERDVLGALTDRAMHGEIEDDEANTLGALAADDEKSATFVGQMLMVEAALRARAACPDVAGAVMQTLKEREQREHAATLAVVMEGVRGRAKPKARRLRNATLMVMAWASAALAFAAITTVAVQRPERLTGKQHKVEKRGQEGGSSGFLSRLERAAKVPPPVHQRLPNEDRANAAASVLEFNFEDGVLPSLFEQGHVVPASEGNGKYVVQGTFNPWAPLRSSVIIGNNGVLFEHQRHLWLRFRYFWEGDGPGIRVQMFNIDQRQNYQWNHAHPQKGAWNSVDVSLDDFYPVVDRTATLTDGDRVQNFYFIGGPLTGNPLLVDDIALRVAR